MKSSINPKQEKAIDLILSGIAGGIPLAPDLMVALTHTDAYEKLALCEYLRTPLLRSTARCRLWSSVSTRFA